MKLIMKAILTACLLSITGTALAATYTVPGNFASIQAAIDSSANGDEIVVSPGTYHEHLVISNRSVSLRSTDGAAQTLIDGDTTGTVVAITAPDDVPVSRIVKLDGFTIQNGVTGIHVAGNHDVTVDNSVITNNNGGHGVNLYTLRPSSDYINFYANNTTISNNYTSTIGGGINTHYHAFPYLKNCKIIDNTSAIHGGAIYMDDYGYSEIENTVITGNTAGQNGGGIYAITYSGFSAVNSVIVTNTAGYYGGAAFLSNGGSARTDNCTIVNNTGIGSIFTNYGSQYGDPSFFARNTIIWAPYPKDNSPRFSNPAKVYIDHSIVQQPGVDPAPYPGVGNMNGYDATRPMFVDYANGDYRLKFWSPGVDQGIPLSGVYLDVKNDINGIVRPQGAAFDLGAYEFVDTAPPVTTATEISGRYIGNGWYYLGAFFTLTANDDVSLKEVHYIVNGTETVVTVPPSPTGTQQYLVPGGYIPVYAEGPNTFTYYAVDIFGNAEAPRTISFNVAQYRPTVSGVVTGTKVGNYYTSDATVTITGQDIYGVKEIHYTINGGVETVIAGDTATINLSTDGNHFINYHAIANTGIDSGPWGSSVFIDKSAPTNNATVTGTLNPNGWYTTDVNVAITATDANYVKELRYTLDGVTTTVSGGFPTVATTVSILTEGTHTLSFYSIDYADNVSATTTLTIKVDKAAPFVASSTPANNATGVLTSASVTINLNETVTQGSAFANIVLKKGTTTVTTTKTLSGSNLTIMPSKALSKSTTYTVTIPANSFVDAAGFSNAAYTLTFITGTR